MVKPFEAIILCREENGKICQQIKLGDRFVADVNKMAESLYFLNSQNK